MELAGTAWTLVDFETDMGVIPTLVEAAATLDFSVEKESEGRLNGSSGCNRYFASFSLVDDHFRIGQLGSTRMLAAPLRWPRRSVTFKLLQPLDIAN